MVHWNARSLKGKVALLRPLLQEQDIDVALISETILGPADKIRFPGFLVYRQDEQSEQGRAIRGLAVLVRRRVVHQELPRLKLRSMYALGVQLHVAGEHLRVYAAYKPPVQELHLPDVHTLLASPHPTIIAGDFNCKHPAWNSNAYNAQGRRLFADAEARGYDVSGPEAPTHYSPNINFPPDVLDIVVHSGLSCQLAQYVLDDEMQSDHQPVLVTLSGHPTRFARQAPRRRTDWTAFAAKLETTTPTRPVTTAADVNGLADELTACIQRAAESAACDTTATQGRFPALPAHIASMIADKRRLRKRWQQTRCPTLKTQLNRLTERVKAELQAHTTASWEDYIDSAGDDWQSVHRTCRHLTNTPAPVRPLHNSDGALRYTAADRAEIFAAHLERQFTPKPTDDQEHVAAVEQHLGEYFRTPIASEEDPVVVSPGQVRRAILRTKPRKAPGADGITNTALRHLPHKTVAALARLYNGILRTGTFPTCWKLGRVIMLHKPGKNSLKPESYRPITLLPTTSKVFEALLLRHLTPHITPRPEQFGFRSEHSTTLQLSRVLHLLAGVVNKREYAAAVFLDMEKAFDRVWHAGLLYKLSLSSAPRRLIQVVSSFLQDRTFKVAVENELSSARPVSAGVPQGSCISPVLYSVYTDDIPATHSSTLALYADDAAYITTSLSAAHAAVKMQRALNDLPDWLSKWRLSVNVGKTQAMIVTARSRYHPPNLTLMGADIAWANRAKYLGVTLDSRLTMGPHVRHTVARVRNTRHMLRPVLSSRIPLRVKLGVYKAYIRPQLTYAAPAWLALTAETHRKKLQVQQNLVLRRITEAPRYVRNSVLHRDLRVESIVEFCSRMAANMFARADASAWPHIKDMAPWHARPPDATRYPRDLVPNVAPPPTGLDA